MKPWISGVKDVFFGDFLGEELEIIFISAIHELRWQLCSCKIPACRADGRCGVEFTMGSIIAS